MNAAVKFLAVCWLLLFAVAPSRGADTKYDPLAVAPEQIPATLDLVVHDENRSRDVPVFVYLPREANTPAPVVLFSHGLGGTRKGYSYLGSQWAQRGYVAVFLQHAGSDNTVWENKSILEGTADMRRAVSAENLILRAGDVHAAIDGLTRWNAADGHPLKGRMDLARIGMSGHSFGAATTESVGGESYPGYGTAYVDKRIKAAVAMSPAPAPFGDNARAFGGVSIPWMLMTGTDDHSPLGLGHRTAESRLGVYDALPPGGKYELVLDKAEHGAFFDRALPGERPEQNPNHHRAILALSTAFWDTYLRDDLAAKKWLEGDGARTVLEAADRWERK